MEEKKAFKVVITDNVTGKTLISNEVNCIIGGIGQNVTVVAKCGTMEIVECLLTACKAIEDTKAHDDMIAVLANLSSVVEKKCRREDK